MNGPLNRTSIFVCLILSKGKGLRPWAAHTYQKFMEAPPGSRPTFDPQYMLVHVVSKSYSHNLTRGHGGWSLGRGSNLMYWSYLENLSVLDNWSIKGGRWGSSRERLPTRWDARRNITIKALRETHVVVRRVAYQSYQNRQHSIFCTFLYT